MFNSLPHQTLNTHTKKKKKVRTGITSDDASEIGAQLYFYFVVQGVQEILPVCP